MAFDDNCLRFKLSKGNAWPFNQQATFFLELASTLWFVTLIGSPC